MKINGFHDYEMLIRRVRFPSIRNAVQSDIIRLESKNKLTKDEIEILWQLRDFIEIFDVLIQPK